MGVRGQHHALGVLTPGNTRHPLNRRLGGPQDCSGRVRKISTLPGFDPRTIQSPYRVAMQTELFRLTRTQSSGAVSPLVEWLWRCFVKKPSHSVVVKKEICSFTRPLGLYGTLYDEIYLCIRGSAFLTLSRLPAFQVFPIHYF